MARHTSGVQPCLALIPLLVRAKLCGRPAARGPLPLNWPTASTCPHAPSVTSSASLAPSATLLHPPTAPVRASALTPRSSTPPCSSEEHPDWGARFIRGVLADSHPEDALPNERTIRRWLHRPDLAPAPPGKRSSRLPRATRPHQRWQVDAADQMHLLDGSPLSWLKAVDECSGCPGHRSFPPRSSSTRCRSRRSRRSGVTGSAAGVWSSNCVWTMVAPGAGGSTCRRRAAGTVAGGPGGRGAFPRSGTWGRQPPAGPPVATKGRRTNFSHALSRRARPADRNRGRLPESRHRRGLSRRG